MPRLTVFNSVSLDGFFVDAQGDMSWAHNRQPDPAWDAFVAGNASGGGALVFGRVTYELMSRYWPTPLAQQNDPVVAERMNAMPKFVFSRTLAEAAWSNTRLLRGELSAEIRQLKGAPGPDLAILGSGSLVAQLAPQRLIDEYQLVLVPVVIGQGRTLFAGVRERLSLKLASARTFGNGNVVLSYAPGE
jgi:dihydrofolate reductase